MRGTITIAIVLVLAGFVPLASGFHLSAGANDAVGVTPEESPDDPTVPLDRQNVGITDPDDCFEASGSADDIAASVDTDEFCGELVYNDLEGTEPLIQPALDTGFALDQHMPAFSMGDGTTVQVTQFDVVQVSEAGFGYFSDGFSTCYVPGSLSYYEAAHDAGNQVGLTPSSEDVHEQEPSDQPCDIYVGAQVAYPNAVNVAQQTTGTMDMNGWMMPNGKTKWIGFLEADIGADPACQGVTVDDDTLVGIVKGEAVAGVDVNCDGEFDAPGAAGATGGLPNSAIPNVCGFFPAEGNKGTLEGTCDIQFFWIGPEEKSDPSASPEDPFFDSEDYSDWCASRAYMCGTNQPGWYAEFLSDALGGHPLNQLLVQEHSTTAYDIFHWVAAPTQSSCGGLQEPGFLFEPSDASPDAAAAYAAHDLDVYTTPSTAAGVRSTSNVDAAANAFVDEETRSPIETVGDALSLPPEATATVTETQAQVDNATLLVHKNSVQEPNAYGDTSQVAIEGDNPKTFIGTDGSAIDADLTRSLDNPLPCDILRGNEQVADPWVPYFDIRTVRDVSGDGLFVSNDAFDPYLTTDRNQDDQNRPGPFQYFHFGEVGMLTDKVDDGFAPDGNNRIFPGADDLYNEDWAYPLFWDMWVDVDETTGDVTIDRDGGCEYTGVSQMTGKLPGLMADAGYGKHTGLINVYYLEEPTYIMNFNTFDIYPFLGQTAYVTMSSNYVEILRQSLGPDLVDGTSDDVDGDVDASAALVTGLINDVLAKMPEYLSNYEGPLVWDPSGVNGVDDQVVILPVETDPTAPPDFSGNCDFPGYGWQNSWSFAHYCGTSQATVCEGDTVAAGYYMEVTDTGPLADTIGGTDAIPAFKPGGEEDDPYVFGTGFHKMYDIDPFDNDPTRNLPERTNPCTPADFETGVRVECPHQVSGVEVTGGTGTIDVTWTAVPEHAAAEEDRSVGDYEYVIEVSDASGNLITTVTDSDDDQQVTISGLSAGDVSVTVRGKYNYETQLTVNSANVPASYDRLGPRSDAVTATVS